MCLRNAFEEIDPQYKLMFSEHWLLVLSLLDFLHEMINSLLDANKVQAWSTGSLRSKFNPIMESSFYAEYNQYLFI